MLTCAAASDGGNETLRTHPLSLRSPATVNRELGMLRLGAKDGKVMRVPAVDLLQEAPVQALRADLQDASRRLGTLLGTPAAIAGNPVG